MPFILIIKSFWVSSFFSSVSFHLLHFDDNIVQRLLSSGSSLGVSETYVKTEIVFCFSNLK